jgi:hypothetical protein
MNFKRLLIIFAMSLSASITFGSVIVKRICETQRVYSDLNVHAEPFYPAGEKEKIMEKIKIKKIEENLYKITEKNWLSQNAKMFDDSFEDEVKYLGDFKFPYVKMKSQKKEKLSMLKVVLEKTLMTSIVESEESLSWASIVKATM